MKAFLSRIAGLAVLLLVVGACISCSSNADLKVGKDRDVRQSTGTFDAHDTVYAVANIQHPSDGTRVTGRLEAISVAGLKPGPVGGFDMTIELLPGENKANFNFPAPPAGWSNGKYKCEVIVLDKAGKEKSRKSVEFTTTGYQPPKRATPTTATAK